MTLLLCCNQVLQAHYFQLLLNWMIVVVVLVYCWSLKGGVGLFRIIESQQEARLFILARVKVHTHTNCSSTHSFHFTKRHSGLLQTGHRLSLPCPPLQPCWMPAPSWSCLNRTSTAGDDQHLASASCLIWTHTDCHGPLEHATMHARLTCQSSSQ